MSDWEDRVQGHAVHETIALIRERLDAVPAQTDPTNLELLDRIRRVADQAASLIADADSMLLTPKLLDIVRACIAPVPPALGSFIQDSDQTHLTSANVALDDLIDDVGWPLAYVAREPAGLREAAATYRRSAGQLIRSLTEEVEQVQERLNELEEASSAAMAAVQASATNATSTIDTSVADAETRLTALTAEIEAQKTRLTTLMSDYNTQFLTGETARTTKADLEISTIVDHAETELAEQVAKHEASRTAAESEHKAAVTDLTSKGTRALAEIADLQASALKLVNTIGAIGFSGSYGSYAAQERGPANKWRYVTAITIIGLIAVQLYLALSHGPAAITWENIAQRSVVSVPFLILAAFAATQSSKHRENERAARQRELELAAMDPYLVLLPIEDQRAIKTEAARRMFAQPATQTNTSDDTIGAPQLLRLIEQFLKREGK